MQEDSQGVTCLHLTLQHEDILERPLYCERYTCFGGMKWIGFWEIYDGNILNFVDGEMWSIYGKGFFFWHLSGCTFSEFRECSVSKIVLDAVL